MTIQQLNQLIASTQAHVNQLSQAYAITWKEWNDINNGKYPTGINAFNKSAVLSQLKNELSTIKASYDAALKMLRMYQAQLQSYYKNGGK